MSAQEKALQRWISPADYEAFCQKSDNKYEWFSGVIWPKEQPDLMVGVIAALSLETIYRRVEWLENTRECTP